jgi:hypothetical protein
MTGLYVYSKYVCVCGVCVCVFVCVFVCVCMCVCVYIYIYIYIHIYHFKDAPSLREDLCSAQKPIHIIARAHTHTHTNRKKMNGGWKVVKVVPGLCDEYVCT